MYTKFAILQMIVSVLLVSSGFGKEYRLGYVCNLTHPNMGFYSGGAMPFMALEAATRDGLLGNNTIRIMFRDDHYQPEPSMGHLIDLYENHGVDGFIGLGESPVLLYTGYLMSFWNLPFMGQGSLDPRLGDDSVYPTLMRFMPPFNKVGPVVKELVAYIGWRRVLVVSRAFDLCEYCGFSVLSELVNIGVIVPKWIKFDEGLGEDDMTRILDGIKSNARVVYFCGDHQEKIKFMIRVHQANLTTPEYVYMINAYRPLDDVFEPWLDESNPDRDILLEASRAFLQVTLLSVDNWEFIRQLMKEHTEKMVEIWNFNQTANGRRTSPYQTFLYDSVYLYAFALNRTLEAGEDPRNGTAFTRIAKTLQFEGASGHVAFDEYGDREPTCSLWYTRVGEVKSRQWGEVVLSNPAGKRMRVDEQVSWRTSDGSVPLDTPVCGFKGELCIEDDDSRQNIILTVVLVGLAAIISFIAIPLFIRKRNINQRVRDLLWRVNHKELVFVEEKSVRRSMVSLMPENGASSIFGESQRGSSHNQSPNRAPSSLTARNGDILRQIALYRGQVVKVNFVRAFNLHPWNQAELAIMRELSHENLNRFVGACVDTHDPYILTAFCQKGSLRDVLENEHIQLDNIFKESLILDLANGMLYLHSSPLKSHGNLKSSNCVIDSRWVLKVTDFHPTCAVLRSKSGLSAEDVAAEKFWTAPEMLRAHERVARGSPAGDIFAFAIIMQEIFYRAKPYFMKDFTASEVIERVKSVRSIPFRPDCSQGREVKIEFVRLMQLCWEEKPEVRPPFSEIKSTLVRICEQGEINIMDRILLKLESYSNNLEDIVRERTHELREEKIKTDSLLYQMIPRVVADKLKQGIHVYPELFDQATVYFSDILGFMAMAAESTPMEVVCLLNDLYEMLDNLIANYDVYKVETISDSYMVVSGIPVRNGSRHVAEIADMSLHILQDVQTLKIRHRPGEIIQLRVGFHTGSCCAGVVGLAMPRYCLFGDTVNTASRMESNGQALKIHISLETQRALGRFGCYHMEERGEMFIKGKGMLKTYWLEGKVHTGQDLVLESIA